jgi:hypothetical protein
MPTHVTLDKLTGQESQYWKQKDLNNPNYDQKTVVALIICRICPVYDSGHFPCKIRAIGKFRIRSKPAAAYSN